jgi:hypothetical protein
MTEHSKRVNGREESSAKSVKRTKRPVAKSVVQTSAAKNGVKSETKEDRERRLAKLEALTIRAFQMAYDNHNRD